MVHHLQTLNTDASRELNSSGYAKTLGQHGPRLSGDLSHAKYSFTVVEEIK
jgi:hypothetical protein